MKSDIGSLNELKNRCYFIPHVVKQTNGIQCIYSWHNENYTQWCRVYSDGFCEQGGIISKHWNTANDLIKLHKSYININYNVSLTAFGKGMTDYNVGQQLIKDKQINQFYISFPYAGNNWGSVNDDNVFGSWESRGYIDLSTL